MKTGFMATSGIITVLLMTACGGGSDDDASPPVQALEAIVIDASNAMDVAFIMLGSVVQVHP
jgi:hypothetical protein